MTAQEKGIVVATRGRHFLVRAENGDRLLCEVRKKVKFEAEGITPVAVGDDVLITRSGDDSGAIEKVFERRTSFTKPIVGVKVERPQVLAANFDRLAAMASVKSPALKTGLIDRFLISARAGGLDSVVIINKIDLGAPDELDGILDAYRKVTECVLVTSALQGTGVPALTECLADHRTLLVGHSGVGKTTLLNALIPGLELETREISAYSGRGKHTTSTIELFEIPSGGYVADSPGLKVLGLWDVERSDLAYYYPEFAAFEHDCRFQPCAHLHEPDCAVKAAVQQGHIARFRYENYASIAASLEDQGSGA